MFTELHKGTASVTVWRLTSTIVWFQVYSQAVEIAVTVEGVERYGLWVLAAL